MTAAICAATLRRLYAAFDARDAHAHAHELARAIRAGQTEVLPALMDHVLGDEWADFAHASLAQRWAHNAGHLYVVCNPVTPQFLKVGMTRLPVDQRLARLNNEAVVGRYECIQSWPVHDRHYLEALAHRHLADLPRFKEHFACHWRQLCPRVEKLIEDDRQSFTAQGFSLPQPAAAERSDSEHPSRASLRALAP